MSRFERDVLMRPGVSNALVFIGVNDMGSQRRNGDDTPDARARLLADLVRPHPARRPCARPGCVP